MTEAQRRMLDFILRTKKIKGRFPTYVEAREWFEWKSNHSVTDMWKRMAKKGILVKTEKSYDIAGTCPCCSSIWNRDYSS